MTSPPVTTTPPKIAPRMNLPTNAASALLSGRAAAARRAAFRPVRRHYIPPFPPLQPLFAALSTSWRVVAALPLPPRRTDAAGKRRGEGVPGPPLRAARVRVPQQLAGEQDPMVIARTGAKAAVGSTAGKRAGRAAGPGQGVVARANAERRWRPGQGARGGRGRSAPSRSPTGPADRSSGAVTPAETSDLAGLPLPAQFLPEGVQDNGVLRLPRSFRRAGGNPPIAGALWPDPRPGGNFIPPAGFSHRQIAAGRGRGSPIQS